MAEVETVDEVVFPDTYQVQHRWDFGTGVHTEFALDGSTVRSVPFTEADYTAWQTARGQGLSTAEATQRSLNDALAGALTDLQTLLDTSNATINAGPAPYIKAVARAERRIIMVLLRRFDAGTG
jgi:hypothetical protein